MLPNTLTTYRDLLGTVLPLTLIDTDNGATTRVFRPDAASQYVLKMSQQTTSENKPVGTLRTLLRLDFTKVLSDGAKRSCFAQIVLGTPASADFTLSEQYGVLIALLTLLTSGIDSTGGVTAAVGGADFALMTDPGPVLFTRLLQGEV